MLQKLPLPFDVETKAILKKVAIAERYLAELNATTRSIPNLAVLLNTLPVQEAKASSEIENIVTTHNDIYISSLGEESSPSSKEVQNYKDALLYGYQIIKEKNLLTSNSILKIQSIIKKNDAGFRTQKGTELINTSGETVYIPPQNSQEIIELMSNLEHYMNDASLADINPIIKMAIIHHQFESIHPFYDGNGRTGRIINILYLTQQKLLDYPVLYLSRYIIENKQQYYDLLQKTRDESSWEEWILYMLDGVISTSQQTTTLIKDMIELMQTYKNKIRSELPNMYSQDLINVLFKHPYTRIEFLEKDLNLHRQTVSKYLKTLSELGLLSRHVRGRNHYYINDSLLELFMR